MRRVTLVASAAFAGFAMMAGSLRADTITFNDGTPPLECRVLEDFEGSPTILVQVNIAAGIKDERTIERSAIEEIKKVPADKMDYDELQKMVWPTPDMLTADEYQERIESLKPFVSKHPASEYVKEVEKLAGLLAEEKEKVEMGGVKLDGAWISPGQRDKHRYNVDADILFRKMRMEAESRGEYEALKIFDRLETKYPASLVFPDAVALAREILPRIEKELQKKIVRNPALVEERMAGLRKLETNEAEHKRTKDAIDAERREFEQIAERENLAKARWRTYYEYDLDSLEDALAEVRKEGNRLLEYNIGALRSTAGLTSKLMEFIYIKDLDKAESFLKDAQSNGGDKATLDKFKKEIERLRKEAKEGAPTPPKTVTPPRDPNVKPPSSDPVNDLKEGLESPAAKRMRELEEEKQRARIEEAEKKAEEEAAAAAVPTDPETPLVTDGGGESSGNPSTGDPDAGVPGTPEAGEQGTATSTNPEGGEGAEASGDPETAEKPAEPVAKPPKNSPAKPAEVGGGLPLWNYILFAAAAVLLAVTVVAKAKQKKKPEGADKAKS